MWNTQSEIEFIKRLGSHRIACKSIPRRDLLRGYLKSLASRTDEDNLHITTIRACAEAELAKEQEGLEAVKDMMTWRGLPDNVSVV